MTSPKRWALASCLAVLAVWIFLGFRVFSPDAPCGDCGVKYVQTRSLIANDFRSMALAYPGAAIDAGRAHFPLQPPFTLATSTGVQSIWSPVVVLVQAPLVMLAGLGGIIALSLLSGLLVLWRAARLTQSNGDWMVPVALGLGTCLWYYAIQPWEHAPAVACSLSSIWMATRPTRAAPLVAGLLLGAAAILRYESLLLAPTVALMLWYVRRRISGVAIAGIAAFAVLTAAAILDTRMYGRPAGAHLLAQVGAVRWLAGAAGVTLEVPGVPVLSFQDRYATVFHYWVTSFTPPMVLWSTAAALAVVALLSRWTRSALGPLAVGLVVLAWAGSNLWALIPAPKTVPGLFSLSPFLVFALMPAPGLDPQSRGRRRILITGCIMAVLIAALTTDTAGGKSVGPRMLLGLIPPLTVSAWQAIAGFLAAGRSALIARLAGWCGVALIAVSIGINSCVLVAYAGRNQADQSILTAVRQSTASVVVADSPATAQVFMALYFDKTIFLAESPQAGRGLAVLLEQSHVPAALVVTREAQPRTILEPYRLESSETVERVTIQRWVR